MAAEAGLTGVRRRPESEDFRHRLGSFAKQGPVGLRMFILGRPGGEFILSADRPPVTVGGTATGGTGKDERLSRGERQRKQ